MWVSFKIVGKLLENYVFNKNICFDCWEKKFLILWIIFVIFKWGLSLLFVKFIVGDGIIYDFFSLIKDVFSV